MLACEGGRALVCPGNRVIAGGGAYNGFAFATYALLTAIVGARRSSSWLGRGNRSSWVMG